MPRVPRVPKVPRVRSLRNEVTKFRVSGRSEDSATALEFLIKLAVGKEQLAIIISLPTANCNSVKILLNQ